LLYDGGVNIFGKNRTSKCHKNTEALFDSNRNVSPEVNGKETKYMFIYRPQN